MTADNIQGRLTSVTLEELNGQGITPLVTTYTYDPAGNKLTENAYRGRDADPLSIHRYLYGEANPVMAK